MNDIFISYAHIDDQPLDAEEKGWISKFHRVLGVKLGQLMGESPTIWRDPKLKGNDIYDEKIVEEFKNARIMISVLTPRYLKSDWCRREITDFYQAAKSGEGVNVNGKSRIIKVVKTPYESAAALEHLPAVFQSILGFDFYEIDPESGRTIEYDEAFGPKAKQSYFSRIYDLAAEIAILLKQLQSDQPIGAKAEAPKSEGMTVFLAAVTSDVEGGREKIARELSERGHHVIPAGPLPVNSAELEAEIIKLLAQADCAVHLIGKKYGFIPEDHDCSVPCLQNRLSADLFKRKTSLKRFIWMPKSLATDDPRQINFIKELQEDPQTQAGAEIFEDSLDNFRDFVVDRLRPQLKAAAAATALALPAKTEGPASVYLMFDQVDDGAVASLEDYLFDQGLEVLVPTFEGEEAEIKNAHLEKMIHCDAVLIFYGSCVRTWVDMKLMSLLKSPGYGRVKPFLAKTIYLAPPTDPRKERYRSNAAEVVVQKGDTFDPALLAGFVQAVKG